MIISNENCICELPNELLNNLRARIAGDLKISEKLKNTPNIVLSSIFFQE